MATFPVLDVTEETTRQQVFDAVVAHLIAQAAPAMTPAGACLYRTENQLACAVGCLLPDNLATWLDLMEEAPDDGFSIGSVKAVDWAPAWLKTLEMNTLLTELQGAHDCKSSWKHGGGLSHEGVSRLLKVAKGHDLKVPEALSTLSN